ncbi:MAG: response regulator [Candidatus Thermoplasmatota archaeon]|nr:response regulator [Candidatus Thermoplasmatota archaeon]MBU4144514.1 response regulator [Candidatus Thermoplasmatota archaeon]MBU4592265.1 response regulator [Candidatus Thermoplasmatota archaeon]
MNILVVDDNRMDRMLIENVLKKHGYRIITANDGEEALNAYNKDSFDLIIIDWMMPPAGGLNICKEIRKIEAETGGFCYVIMVTGKNLVEDEVRAFEAGVNDFISKPFDQAILVARVKAGMKIVNDRKTLTQATCE